MVDLDTLGLSSRLVKALRAWAREWERLLGPAFEVRDEDAHERWLSDGRRLAERLQEEVGMRRRRCSRLEGRMHPKGALVCGTVCETIPMRSRVPTNRAGSQRLPHPRSVECGSASAWVGLFAEAAERRQHLSTRSREGPRRFHGPAKTCDGRALGSRHRCHPDQVDCLVGRSHRMTLGSPAPSRRSRNAWLLGVLWTNGRFGVGSDHRVVGVRAVRGGGLAPRFGPSIAWRRILAVHHQVGVLSQWWPPYRRSRLGAS